MTVKSYSTVRQNLAAVMDEVCDSNAPMIITRQKKRAVVMLSLDEYESMQETLHLLGSARNAERLRSALDSAAHGRVKQRRLRA